MSVLSRIFARRQTKPSEPTASSVPFSRTLSGMPLSSDQALRVATVWACCSVISKAMASSPWEVFTETADGNRQTRHDSRLWRLLNVAPNTEMTAFAFRETAVLQAALTANFYAEIERNDRGEPVALWPLDGQDCDLDRTPDGRLVLQVRGNDGPATLPYRDVYHLHGMSWDGLNGIPILAYAAETIGLSWAAERFGASFYGNGTQMGGMLSTDTPMSAEQAEALRTAIEARHKGVERAHKFLLLSGGLKFTPMAPTPVDSQFIETRQFVVEEICRWFGVPPHKVQHLLRSTFSNIEHQGIEFVRDALTPWAERLRQEADTKLTPFGNRLIRTRIDIEWMADGDAQSMAQALSQLASNGIITRNEARRKLGLNSLPEADTLTVQSQNITLGATPTDLEAAATGEEVDDNEI